MKAMYCSYQPKSARQRHFATSFVHPAMVRQQCFQRVADWEYSS